MVMRCRTDDVLHDSNRNASTSTEQQLLALFVIINS